VPTAESVSVYLSEHHHDVIDMTPESDLHVCTWLTDRVANERRC